MAGLMTVTLNVLRFHAPHGLHDEEAKTGNDFEVDVSVCFYAPEKPIADIHDTVNYVEVHRIVAQEMQERRQLLETIAMNICRQLPSVFAAVAEATVSIKKLTPPIAGFTGSVGVCYTHKYEHPQ